MRAEKDLSQGAVERFGIVICPVHLVALTDQFDAKAVDPCAFKVIVHGPQGAVDEYFFQFEKRTAYITFFEEWQRHQGTDGIPEDAVFVIFAGESMGVNEAPDCLTKMKVASVSVCVDTLQRLYESVLVIGRYRQRLSSKYVAKPTFICTSLNFTKHFAVRCKALIFEEHVNDGKRRPVFAENVEGEQLVVRDRSAPERSVNTNPLSA